ncbi:MAG: hypothetical protein FJ096_22360 [Deltaproteobacteria bacterium]|nr:hypothetical protein [Deltaproteobacteria bacterium]
MVVDPDAATPALDAAAPALDAATPALDAATDIGPCGREGGRVCGGNGVGGDPAVLYTCRDGLRVPVERCALGCDWLPAGVPDRCARAIDDVPAALIDALDARPYVEGECVDVVHPGWPHPAQRCRYSAGPLSSRVVVANPSPERVARWIIDAAGVIPALDALRETDRAAWIAGLRVVARQVMTQSSRIFPLSGGIIENMGDGWIDYPFNHGVSDPCGAGCYCRINSLHRTEFCRYQDAMGRETERACLERVGARGYTDAWGAQCQGNHERAWTSDLNEHFRARLYVARDRVLEACADGCEGAEIVDALRAALP